MPVRNLETWTELTEQQFATSQERRDYVKKQRKKLKKKRYLQRKKLKAQRALEPKETQLKAAHFETEVGQNHEAGGNETGKKKRKRNRGKKCKVPQKDHEFSDQNQPPVTEDDQTLKQPYDNYDDIEFERSPPHSLSELAAEISDQINSPVLRSIVQHLPPIDEQLKVKIADLGNGCWVDHHFSTQIQTLQYRSPEVILGLYYNTSADIWSLACMLFELATGDFLFDPKGGTAFSKEDDHLAQMVEALGKMPKNFALSGDKSKRYFDNQGRLRKMSQLKHWPIRDILMEKYGFKEDEAKALDAFLSPMLRYQLESRATATECLGHFWLNMPSNYDTKMSEAEYEGVIARVEKRHKEIKAMESRGDSLSSPESQQEGSAWEGDVEDNRSQEYSSSQEDSSSEIEAAERPKFEEVIEYHDRMAKLREIMRNY